MGMLMHHTWLEQQKQKKPEKAEKPVAVEEEPEKEPVPVEPVKRTGGRRKVSN